MPYCGLTDGLYLVCKKAVEKGVDHYGVLDIGNRLNLANADGINPVVIHQTPPEITVNTLKETGPWYVIEFATNEPETIERFWRACNDPEYNTLTNNCEHFARYVITGNRESKQLQTAVLLTGLVVLTIYGLSRKQE